MPDGKDLVEEERAALGLPKREKPQRLTGQANGLDVPRVIDDELAKLGWTPTARLNFLGNVGRENGWRPSVIFGTHADPANGATNQGVISYQGDRRTNMLRYLRDNGGDLTPNEQNLRLMVRFADKEMSSYDEWKNVHRQMRDPNLSTRAASEALRRYVKYVPEPPYNTPDAEWGAVNNRRWAEKARKLGLAQGASGGDGGSEEIRLSPLAQNELALLTGGKPSSDAGNTDAPKINLSRLAQRELDSLTQRTSALNAAGEGPQGPMKPAPQPPRPLRPVLPTPPTPAPTEPQSAPAGTPPPQQQPPATIFPVDLGQSPQTATAPAMPPAPSLPKRKGARTAQEIMSAVLARRPDLAPPKENIPLAVQQARSIMDTIPTGGVNQGVFNALPELTQEVVKEAINDYNTEARRQRKAQPAPPKRAAAQRLPNEATGVTAPGALPERSKGEYGSRVKVLDDVEGMQYPTVADEELTAQTNATAGQQPANAPKAAPRFPVKPPLPVQTVIKKGVYEPPTQDEIADALFARLGGNVVNFNRAYREHTGGRNIFQLESIEPVYDVEKGGWVVGAELQDDFDLPTLLEGYAKTGDIEGAIAFRDTRYAQAEFFTNGDGSGKPGFTDAEGNYIEGDTPPPQFPKREPEAMQPDSDNGVTSRGMAIGHGPAKARADALQREYDDTERRLTEAFNGDKLTRAAQMRQPRAVSSSVGQQDRSAFVGPEARRRELYGIESTYTPLAREARERSEAFIQRPTPERVRQEIRNNPRTIRNRENLQAVLNPVTRQRLVQAGLPAEAVQQAAQGISSDYFTPANLVRIAEQGLDEKFVGQLAQDAKDVAYINNTYGTGVVREFRDFIAGAGRGAGNLATDAVVGLAEIISLPFADQRLRRNLALTGQDIKKGINWLAPRNPRGDIVQDVGEGTGSAASFAVGGWAFGGSKVAIAGLGALTGFANGYEDAIKHEASENAALTSGFINAAIGTSEIVGVGSSVSRLNKAAGGKLLKALREAAKEATEEAAQETFQTIMGNITAKQLYDADREAFEGLFGAFSTATLTGGLFSGIVTVLGNLRRRNALRKLRKIRAGREVNLTKAEQQTVTQQDDLELTTEAIALFGEAAPGDDIQGQDTAAPTAAPAAQKNTRQRRAKFGVANVTILDEPAEPGKTKIKFDSGGESYVDTSELQPLEETPTEASPDVARPASAPPAPNAAPPANEPETPLAAQIDADAHQAATSPENNLPEPTQAQKEAGNYQKGHILLHGFDISIENPRGSERSGTDRDGKPWSVTMQNHYGYIRRTVGADDEQVDVFIGPNPESEKVFIVDQTNPDDGSFDEHKVLLGYNTLEAAKKGYYANYAKTWKGGENINETDLAGFKEFLNNGDTKQPYKPLNATSAPVLSADAVQTNTTDAQPAPTDRPAKREKKEQPVPTQGATGESQFTPQQRAAWEEWKKANPKKWTEETADIQTAFELSQGIIDHQQKTLDETRAALNEVKGNSKAAQAKRAKLQQRLAFEESSLRQYQDEQKQIFALEDKPEGKSFADIDDLEKSFGKFAWELPKVDTNDALTVREMQRRIRRYWEESAEIDKAANELPLGSRPVHWERASEIGVKGNFLNNILPERHKLGMSLDKKVVTKEEAEREREAHWAEINEKNKQEELERVEREINQPTEELTPRRRKQLQRERQQILANLDDIAQRREAATTRRRGVYGPRRAPETVGYGLKEPATPLDLSAPQLEAKPTAEAAAQPGQSQSAKFKYSSTQVDLPARESRFIVVMGKELIPDADLYHDPDDDSYGREEKPHITIKYGLHTSDIEEVKRVLAAQPPFTAELGKTKVFKGADTGQPYDVVVIEVKSPELHRLNALVSDNLEVTDTFPEYHPHVTLAYVQAGKGEPYAGLTKFEGESFRFNEITFSAQDGTVTPFALNGPVTVLPIPTPPDERTQERSDELRRQARILEREARQWTGRKAIGAGKRVAALRAEANEVDKWLPYPDEAAPLAAAATREQIAAEFERQIAALEAAEKTNAEPAGEPADTKATQENAPAPPVFTIAQARAALEGPLKPFISAPQRAVMRYQLNSEEREFFVKQIQDLAQVVEDMPTSTGRRKGEGTAYLHYFLGSADFFITEKDKGRQLQAFGLGSLFGDDAELGYINIEELVENNFELDLYWTPQHWKEIQDKRYNPDKPAPKRGAVTVYVSDLAEDAAAQSVAENTFTPAEQRLGEGLAALFMGRKETDADTEDAAPEIIPPALPAHLDAQKYAGLAAHLDDYLAADEFTAPLDELAGHIVQLMQRFGLNAERLRGMAPYLTEYVYQRSKGATDNETQTKHGTDRRLPGATGNAEQGTINATQSADKPERTGEADNRVLAEGMPELLPPTVHEGQPSSGGETTVGADATPGNGTVSTGSRARRKTGTDGPRAISTAAGKRSVERKKTAREAADVDGTALDKNLKPVAEVVADAKERAAEEAAQGAPKTDKNYYVTDLSAHTGGSLKQKYARNIAAIETLRQIQREGREMATPEEQAVLARYIGWGQFAALFNDITATGEKWSEERDALRQLLGEVDFAAARASTKNAHYTSPEIVAATWDLVKKLGFTNGRVLEPAMGTGNFFMLMPPDLRSQVTATGIELDPTTAAISKLLYPGYDIRQSGYQEFAPPAGFYDLAISNVPFGKYPVADAAVPYNVRDRIHNYFFGKAATHVRPGGLIAFITSTGTLDRSPDTLKYMSRRADLVGAIRFPANTFARDAGTAVVTDLVIFRVKDPAHDERVIDNLTAQQRDLSQTYNRLNDLNGRIASADESEKDALQLQARAEQIRAKSLEDAIRSAETLIKEIDRFGNNKSWLDTGAVDDPAGGLPIPLNNYYIEHPEMVLGTIDRTGKMHSRPDQPNVTRTPDFEERFMRAVDAMPANVMQARRQNVAMPAYVAAPENAQTGSFLEQDGKVYQVEGTSLKPVELTAAQAETFRAMLGVRDTRNQIIKAELAGQREVANAARQTLNKRYDEFAAKHGSLHEAMKKTGVFDSTTPDTYILASLETWDKKKKRATKADIFERSTVTLYEKPLRADSYTDALATSLNESGTVDINRIAELMGAMEDEAAKELSTQGLAYHDPRDGWTQKAVYLGGEVRRKLAEAMEAAQSDEMYQANVDALQTVQPSPIPYTNIKPHLGAVWLPETDLQEFLAETVRSAGNETITAQDFNIARLATGDVMLNYAQHPGENITEEILGTRQRDFLELVEHAIADRQVTVTYKDAEGNTRVNRKATRKANRKLDAIKKKFERWIWRDDERRIRLYERFNELYNDTVPVEWDGSHLTLPGMAEGWFKFRKSQLAAIWQLLVNGRLMAAHEVGTGKTAIMVAGAMELRRLGLAKKPMILCLNSNVHQVAEAARAMYPNAKVLSAFEGMDAATRKLTTARIATGDWDMVILTHDNFELLPMSKATQQRFIQEELDIMREQLREMMDEDEKARNSYAVKQLENAIATRKAKLQEILQKPQDDVVTFEELGVDFLMVDEAHQFKNLKLVTRRQAKGIPSSASDRGFRLFMATRWLTERQKGRGVALLTGTPISNTLAEAFNIQRFLDWSGLKRKGLHLFDNWASNFAAIDWVQEMGADGQLKIVSALSYFRNMHVLSRSMQGYLNVAFAKDVPGLVRPARRDRVVKSRQSEEQKSYQAFLRRRAQKLQDGRVDKKEDNWLLLGTHARWAAIDLRLLNNNAEDDPDSKTNQVVREVLEYYAAHNKQGKPFTQFIFADVGVNATKLNPDFVLYDDIINKLVAGGIPRDRIANFGELKTGSRARDAAIKKLNDGDIVVAVGSTEKLGTGINAQQWAGVAHHIDIKYRPADDDQRNGRIWRSGNKHKTVDVVRYVTEDSFDMYFYGLLERKSQFIKDFLSGNSLGDGTIFDPVDDSLTYNTVMAYTSSNPKMKEYVDAKQELDRLEDDFTGYEEEQFAYRDKGVKNQREVANLEKSINRQTKAIEEWNAAKEERTFTLNGESYTIEPDAERNAKRQAIADINRQADNAPDEADERIATLDAEIEVADKLAHDMPDIGWYDQELEKAQALAQTDIEQSNLATIELRKRFDKWLRDYFKPHKAKLEKLTQERTGLKSARTRRRNELRARLMENGNLPELPSERLQKALEKERRLAEAALTTSPYFPRYNYPDGERSLDGKLGAFPLYIQYELEGAKDPKDSASYLVGGFFVKTPNGSKITVFASNPLLEYERFGEKSDKDRTSLEKVKNRLEKEIAQVKGQIGQPFEQLQELQALRVQVSNLGREIGVESMLPEGYKETDAAIRDAAGEDVTWHGLKLRHYEARPNAKADTFVVTGDVRALVLGKPDLPVDVLPDAPDSFPTGWNTEHYAKAYNALGEYEALYQKAPEQFLPASFFAVHEGEDEETALNAQGYGVPLDALAFVDAAYPNAQLMAHVALDNLPGPYQPVLVFDKGEIVGYLRATDARSILDEELLPALRMAHALSLTAARPDKATPLTRWFKRSRVATPGGDPLPVYRGAALEQADTPEALRVYAESPEFANYMAQGFAPEVEKSHLSIQKPFTENTSETDTGVRVYEPDPDTGETVSVPYDVETSPFNPEWLKLAQEKGFDGATGLVKFGDEMVRLWIPFDATQIKSATGNQGTFDKSNPNVLMMARTGQDEKRIADIQLMHTPDLVENATFAPGIAVNSLEMNAEGAELMRRVFEEISRTSRRHAAFDGIFTLPSMHGDIRRELSRLEVLIANGELVGREADPALAGRLRELAGTFSETKPKVVLYVYDDALPHEEFHRAGYEAAQGAALEARHKDFAILAAMPQIEKAWQGGLNRIPGMSFADKAVMVEEVAAWSAAGQWADIGLSEAEAVEYLTAWFASVEAQLGPQALDYFADVKELRHVQEIIENIRAGRTDAGPEIEDTTQEPATGARPPAYEGGGGLALPAPEHGSRDSGNAGRIPSLQTGQAPDPGPTTGSGAESPAQSYPTTGRVSYATPDGEIRLRSLPATLRRQGLIAGDLYYQRYSRKAQDADARRMLADLGFRASLARVFGPEALGAAEMQLARHLMKGLQLEAENVRSSDKDESLRLLDLSGRIKNHLAERLTQAGQLIEAAKEAAEDAASFVNEVRRLVKENQGRELTDEELERAWTMGRDAEERSADDEAAHVVAEELRRLRDEAETLAKDADAARKAAARARAREATREKRINELQEIIDGKRDEVRQRRKGVAGHTIRENAIALLEVDEADVLARLKGSGMLLMGRQENLLAPNGKPSNLNSWQHRIVRTPAFKAWFGDWENDPQHASQIVDENGEPRVVYHGTKKSFDAFDATATARHEALHQFGFFFGDTPEVGNFFAKGAKGNVLPVFLSLKKPKLEPPVKGSGFSLTNSLERDYNESERESYFADAKTAHDGIIFQTTDGFNELLAFDATQIKSATGNQGTFDKSNPNVLMMARPVERLNQSLLDDLTRLVALRRLRAEKGAVAPADFRASLIAEFGDRIEANVDEIMAKGELLKEDTLTQARYEAALHRLAQEEGNENLSQPDLEALYHQEIEEEKRLRRIENEYKKAAMEFVSRPEQELTEFERAERAGQREAERIQRRHKRQQEARTMPSKAVRRHIAVFAGNDAEAFAAMLLGTPNATPSGVYQALKDRFNYEPHSRVAQEVLRRGNLVLEAARLAARFESEQAGVARESLGDAKQTARNLADARARLTRDDYIRALVQRDVTRTRRRQAAQELKRELKRLASGRVSFMVGEAWRASKSVPLSLMASGDVSNLGRQGALAIAAAPHLAPRFIAGTFGSISHEQFLQRMDDMEHDPALPVIQAVMGVEFAFVGQDVDAGEEWFEGENYLRRAAEGRLRKWPGLGHAARGAAAWVHKSDEIFGGGLDVLRFELAKLWMRELADGGYNPAEHKAQYQAVGEFINMLTGRTDLDKLAARGDVHAKILSTIIPVTKLIGFAPRYRMSRLEYVTMPLSPHYWRLPPGARGIIWRKWGRSVATMGLSLAAISAFGALTGLYALDWDDPDDDDWMKLKVGMQRVDLTGGSATQARLLWRMALDAYRVTRGRVTFGMAGRESGRAFFRWVQSGLDPRASFLTELASGRDFNGQPFSWKWGVASRLLPITWVSAVRTGTERGLKYGISSFVPDFLGFSTQVYPTQRADEPQTEAERLARRFADKGSLWSDLKDLVGDTRPLIARELLERGDALKSRARKGESGAAFDAEVAQLARDGYPAEMVKRIWDAQGKTLLQDFCQTLPPSLIRIVLNAAGEGEKAQIYDLLQRRAEAKGAREKTVKEILPMLPTERRQAVEAKLALRRAGKKEETVGAEISQQINRPDLPANAPALEHELRRLDVEITTGTELTAGKGEGKRKLKFADAALKEYRESVRANSLARLARLTATDAYKSLPGGADGDVKRKAFAEYVIKDEREWVATQYRLIADKKQDKIERLTARRAERTARQPAEDEAARILRKLK